MNWKGKPAKTVFILGAGATRGAFSHVRINRKKISAPLNKDFFKIAEAFSKAQKNAGFLHRFARIRRVFREEFPTRGRWPIPMEEAFSLLYASKAFTFYQERGKPREAGSRREIGDFLRLTFGILTGIEKEVTTQDVPNYYIKLAAHLQPGDTVITLNYDTLLDTALVDAGWSPEKGYGLISGKSISWKRQKPNPNPLLKDVKLLKLHGSLNWYVRGSFRQLENIFAAKPTKVLISELPRKNEIAKSVRQIIPPIHGKFFAHRHWQKLWGQAHDALLEADVLVIVGCSLAPADFHFSGMIGNALTRRKATNTKFSRVVAVDCVQVYRKWFDLVGGGTKTREHYPRFDLFAKRYLR